MVRSLLLLGFLGFIGAVPLPLFSSVLAIRLKEGGFETASIGFLSWLHLPYGLKVFLGPWVDQKSPPSPFDRFERKKGWMLLALTTTFIGLLFINIATSSLFLVGGSIVLGYSSAAITYLAGLQVEIYLAEKIGKAKASSAVVTGYRLGLLFSGAGSLFLAELWSWEGAYLFSALFILLPIPLLLTTPLPETRSFPKPFSYSESFLELLKRLLPLLPFLFFYRLGDDLADPMFRLFLIDLGFSKMEIGQTSKIVGMAATFLGVGLAGWLKKKESLDFSLAFYGLLHGLSFFTFSYLKEGDLFWLSLSVALEHFTGGMVLTVWIASLWTVVSPSFASTQYALLSSLLFMKKSFFGGLSGLLVEVLGWDSFFQTVGLLSVLGTLTPFLSGLTTRSEQNKMGSLSN